MTTTGPRGQRKTATGAVVIPNRIRRRLIAHARRDRPDECCGLLVGHRHEIAVAVALPNVARERRTRFEVDPRGHIALRRVLRACTPRLQLMGCYHSHPSGEAVLSPRDVASAHYADWIHVVVGLGGGRAQVRAYRIISGRPVPVQLRPPQLILPAVSSSPAPRAGSRR